MKIMDIIKFHTRIIKIMKTTKNQTENYETNENHRIPIENHENHKK